MRSHLILGAITILGLLLVSCAPAVAPPPLQPAKPPSGAAGGQTTATGVLMPTPKAAGQPRYGGLLTVSTWDDPPSMDIHQEVSYLTQNILRSAYNGITQFNPENPEEVIGDLAKGWEVSKDGLIYTFHLSEGVRFHDGTGLTANDVRFSFERQTNPPKGVLAPRRGELAAIGKIEAPDKDTVRFILKYPASSFLNVLSSGFNVIYSEAFVDKKGDMKRDVMGSGPYKFKRYSRGIAMEHVKNGDYFVKGRPHVDGITFYVLKDAATKFAAFRTGQIKLTGPGTAALRPSEAEIVKTTLPQIVITSYPSFAYGTFVLNTTQEPWTDIRVRRAAHLAIDRQAAVKVLTEGYGYVGSSMPGKWGIPEDELVKLPGFRQPKDEDIAEAKKLLAEAGYPKGFTVKGLVMTGRKYENTAIFLADQMSKVGIKLELDVREVAVRTNLLNQGAFNSHPGTASLHRADPENVARFWDKPIRDDWGQNWQRYADEKISELFEKQSRAIDPEERKKIVRELDLRLIDSAARPLVFWENAILGMWPQVRNRGKLSGNTDFQSYQDVWLAK